MPSGLFPPSSPVRRSAAARGVAARGPAEVERHGAAEVTVTPSAGRPRGDGEVALKRFYWSTQQEDPSAPRGFGARTPLLRGTSASRRCTSSPSDPALPWLDDDDGPLRPAAGRALDILRYIPLRRLTYRLHDGAGLPAASS